MYISRSGDFSADDDDDDDNDDRRTDSHNPLRACAQGVKNIVYKCCIILGYSRLFKLLVLLEHLYIKLVSGFEVHKQFQ